MVFAPLHVKGNWAKMAGGFVPVSASGLAPVVLKEHIFKATWDLFELMPYSLIAAMETC